MDKEREREREREGKQTRRVRKRGMRDGKGWERTQDQQNGMETRGDEMGWDGMRSSSQV